MKKNIIFSIVTLLLFPTVVFAKASTSGLSLSFALFMEAFATIHMSVFVLKPLSKILSKENDKKLFWKLFWIRVGVLIFFDLFVTTTIVIVDFLAIFVGAFIIMPLSLKATNKKINNNYDATTTTTNSIPSLNSSTNNKGVILKCAKCGNELKIEHSFCTNCGEAFDGNNVTVDLANQTNSAANQNIIATQSKIPVLPSSFDPMYSLSEDKMIEEFINRELTKAGIDKNISLIPYDILKRKKVLNMILSVLIFVFISLIFFHFPIYTYIIGLVLLFIFYKVTRKYNLMKYLKKQLKARPSEKISNIVMNAKTTFVTDNSKNIFVISICLAIILPLLIFIEPRILYEKTENGYAVRYYMFGLTNFTTATIPEKYKDEPVVSLRGNTFSNMPLLKKVNLPDTITEIRGQAFKNNISLTEVNLPKKLEYLGGGAFYNCSSLTSIEIPDTVTYIGGEAFYNASSLETIKLSNNITEIRGSTFGECSSLKSISIPDSVTRIGGHAFYGCNSLSEVTLTENSLLKEIGSSAFRKCDSLYSIKLPNNVYINERAFKESPTKVKKFGEIDYGSLIDSNNYTYNSYIFMYIGENEEINEFRKNAYIQDAYIYLESIKTNSDSNEFTLKYSDTNGEQIFTLSANEPYKIINDNLAVEIASDYVLKHDNNVSLNIYYN